MQISEDEAVIVRMSLICAAKVTNRSVDIRRENDTRQEYELLLDRIIELILKTEDVLGISGDDKFSTDVFPSYVPGFREFLEGQVNADK